MGWSHLLWAGISVPVPPGWECPGLTPGDLLLLAHSRPDGEGGMVFIYLKNKTKRGNYLKFCVKLYFYELHVVMLMLFSLSENWTIEFNYTQ